MSRPVIIVGAGGHGKVVAETLRASGLEVLCFIDADVGKHGTMAFGLPVLGGDAVLDQYEPAAVSLANGIGSTASLAARRAVFERLTAAGFSFEPLVHPRAFVAQGGRVGAGAQIMAGAIVQCDTMVGADSIVNTGAIVDHDCRIGRHCHVSPGSVLSGGVHLGDEVHVGVGAVIRQGIRVGSRALIAAGALVLDDVADDARVQGLPARRYPL